jgi:hypothetical protein
MAAEVVVDKECVVACLLMPHLSWPSREQGAVKSGKQGTSPYGCDEWMFAGSSG